MKLKMIAVLLVVFTSAAYADGNRTLQEVREDLLGASIEQPAANSLLGQYLNATGADTIIRSFKTAPKGNQYPPSEKGPRRLVVAVDEKNSSEFARLFNNPNMLYLVYRPNGSMLAAHRGKSGNYARLNTDLNQILKNPSYAGTLLVPIVLSDSEASRATKFFEMGNDPTLNPYAQQPWGLLNQKNQPYSAKTGFYGCTSWFSSIPLGDQLMESYTFPSEDKDGMTPRVKPLVDYVVPRSFTPEQEKLTREVWKVPGHQQLGEMLNPMASRRGEFTNVGWIAYSLLGSQDTERVPLVFLLVDDVKKQINRKFKVQISEE